MRVVIVNPPLEAVKPAYAVRCAVHIKTCRVGALAIVAIQVELDCDAPSYAALPPGADAPYPGPLAPVPNNETPGILDHEGDLSHSATGK
jgi:hypothetical protein